MGDLVRYHLDMARALTTELAKVNIVAKKCDSSKIGGKSLGRLQEEAGRGQGFYTTARASTSNTRAAAQDAASSIHDQVAGMPAVDH
jgi:hypothetical protein